MTYTDVICPNCKAPVGKRCTTRNGHTARVYCRARMREVDNIFLAGLGMQIVGPLDD